LRTLTDWSLKGFACLALVVMTGGSALAEEKAAPKNLGDFKCKEIMVLTDDRDVGVAALLGFSMGKSGITALDLEKLSAAVDRFTDDCLEHPNAPALERMGKALSGK